MNTTPARHATFIHKDLDGAISLRWTFDPKGRHRFILADIAAAMQRTTLRPQVMIKLKDCEPYYIGNQRALTIDETALVFGCLIDLRRGVSAARILESMRACAAATPYGAPHACDWAPAYPKADPSPKKAPRRTLSTEDVARIAVAVADELCRRGMAPQGSAAPRSVETQ